MLGKKPEFLPDQDGKTYQVLSTLLYALFLIGLVYSAMAFLFPYVRYTFDFNNPDATKNTLFSPHAGDFSSIRDGKVIPFSSLALYANNWHILESGKIEIRPSKKSNEAGYLEGKQIAVKHGWAATFAQRGEQIVDIPNKIVREYQGSYYEQRGKVLFPYVSKAAALSHVPVESVKTLTDTEFAAFAQGEEFLGFRIGTLISYADGVFVVSENNSIKPFGSPKILLRMGYSFDHVIAANAEEAGIYKRGKIILPGQMHPSGTLFQEIDTEDFFIYENMTFSKLTKEYGEFLKKSNDVVPFSEKEGAEEATCALEKELFQKSYACELSINFSGALGDDYQVIFLNGNQATDIATVTAGFQSSRKYENARAVIIVLTNRILERFGITQGITTL